MFQYLAVSIPLTAAAILAHAPVDAALLSPFPSSIPEISIPNTHLFARKQGVALRGMAPLTADQVTELTDFGINEVLVFRNDVPGESGIATELALLSSNPKIRAVHLIPFQWKDINDFRAACQDTVKGLQIIRTALSTRGAGLFFHCTVGEDRTGYLAGLYRILFERMSSKRVLETEMCAHGYGGADPTKAGWVVQTIHDNVTVLFLKMRELIRIGALRAEDLNLAACEQDPIRDPKFREKLARQLERFKCSPIQTHLSFE